MSYPEPFDTSELEALRAYHDMHAETLPYCEICRLISTMDANGTTESMRRIERIREELEQKIYEQALIASNALKRRDEVLSSQSEMRFYPRND